MQLRYFNEIKIYREITENLDTSSVNVILDPLGISAVQTKKSPGVTTDGHTTWTEKNMIVNLEFYDLISLYQRISGCVIVCKVWTQTSINNNNNKNIS